MADEIQVPYIPPESAEDIFYRAEALRAVKELLEDKIAEKNLGIDFELWSIISKTYKLTFFEEADVYTQENLFEAEVCKMLRSIPPCMHSPKLYLQIGQARMIFHANLRRSLGTTNRNKLNERIAQVSQFRQVMTSSQFSSRSAGGGVRGFFRKLIGR